MDSLIEFLRMGGYAAFVWPSFGATAVIMVAVLIASLRMLKANERALDALKGNAPDETPAEAADEAQA